MLGRAHDDALDGGPRKGAPATERFCAATGEVKPVDEMIRFVLGPDGTAVPDLRRRLPGRGIWITATRQALRVAIARKAFARGFKRDVRLAPDFVDSDRAPDRAGRARCSRDRATRPERSRSALPMSRRALTRARVVALLNAAEAAPDGGRKLAGGAAPARGDAAEIAVIDAFTSAQLDLAFGPVKCDTCSPACRSRKRDVSGARRAP